MRFSVLLTLGWAVTGVSFLMLSSSRGEESAVTSKLHLKTITNSLGMELVLITPEKSVKEIPNSTEDRESWEERSAAAAKHPFYIGKTEVTQAQWFAVMETSPWKNQTEAREGKNLAATFMRWEDVQAFCEKLTEKEGHGKYRLPTEAEWDYASRAGTKTRYSFGDDQTELDKYAWNADNADKIGEGYAHEVGQKRANPFGLFDMHGNAWELVDGLYASESEILYPSKTGNLHVAMGGSWRSRRITIEGQQVVVSTPTCFSGESVFFGSTHKSGELGFRVAWTADEK